MAGTTGKNNSKFFLIPQKEKASEKPRLKV
jgi:hypothetical protein